MAKTDRRGQGRHYCNGTFLSSKPLPGAGGFDDDNGERRSSRLMTSKT